MGGITCLGLNQVWIFIVTKKQLGYIYKRIKPPTYYDPANDDWKIDEPHKNSWLFNVMESKINVNLFPLAPQRSLDTDTDKKIFRTLLPKCNHKKLTLLALDTKRLLQGNCWFEGKIMNIIKFFSLVQFAIWRSCPCKF